MFDVIHEVHEIYEVLLQIKLETASREARIRRM